MRQLHLGALCVGIYKWAQSDRHRRQAADLPAKVANRIGCAHKRGCSLEIGWRPIFVKILGHKFLVIILGQFLCHLSMQDNLYCLAHVM